MLTTRKKYYEVHLTLEGCKKKIERAVKEIKWKFSCIDGDPVMGRGLKCYATMHYKDSIPPAAVLIAVELAVIAMKGHGITVTREKIELVIYDSRSESVRIPGEKKT